MTHEELLRSAEGLPLVACPTCDGTGALWDSIQKIRHGLVGGCLDCGGTEGSNGTGQVRAPLAVAAIAAVAWECRGVYDWRNDFSIPGGKMVGQVTHDLLIDASGTCGVCDTLNGIYPRPHPEPGSDEEKRQLGMLRYGVLPAALLVRDESDVLIQARFAFHNALDAQDYQAALDAVGEALAAVTA